MTLLFLTCGVRGQSLSLAQNKHDGLVQVGPSGRTCIFICHFLPCPTPSPSPSLSLCKSFAIATTDVTSVPNIVCWSLPFWLNPLNLGCFGWLVFSWWAIFCDPQSERTLCCAPSCCVKSASSNSHCGMKTSAVLKGNILGNSRMLDAT